LTYSNDQDIEVSVLFLMEANPKCRRVTIDCREERLKVVKSGE